MNGENSSACGRGHSAGSRYSGPARALVAGEYAGDYARDIDGVDAEVGRGRAVPRGNAGSAATDHVARGGDARRAAPFVGNDDRLKAAVAHGRDIDRQIGRARRIGRKEAEIAIRPDNVTSGSDHGRASAEVLDDDAVPAGDIGDSNRHIAAVRAVRDKDAAAARGRAGNGAGAGHAGRPGTEISGKYAPLPTRDIDRLDRQVGRAGPVRGRDTDDATADAASGHDPCSTCAVVSGDDTKIATRHVDGSDVQVRCGRSVRNADAVPAAADHVASGGDDGSCRGKTALAIVENANAVHATRDVDGGNSHGGAGAVHVALDEDTGSVRARDSAGRNHRRSEHAVVQDPDAIRATSHVVDGNERFGRGDIVDDRYAGARRADDIATGEDVGTAAAILGIDAETSEGAASRCHVGDIDRHAHAAARGLDARTAGPEDVAGARDLDSAATGIRRQDPGPAGNVAIRLDPDGAEETGIAGRPDA